MHVLVLSEYAAQPEIDIIDSDPDSDSDSDSGG
jgi:hypothetical protein